MSITDDLAALAADFTGWHIWRGRSLSGRETDWHATARERGRKPGRLSAPDAAGLRDQLAACEALKVTVAA